MKIKIRDKHAVFPCGCKFPLASLEGTMPVRIKYWPTLDNTPLDCPLTWELFSKGDTKGVFQLETQLGQENSKKLAPETIEHLAALAAVLRPGCIAKDSKIVLNIQNHKDGRPRYRTKSIESLYETFHRNVSAYKNTIISYDEKNHCMVKNKIIDVMYNGKKDIVKLLYSRQHWKSRHNTNKKYLKCTPDHPVFTYSKGWTKVEDLSIGDRFVALGRRSDNKNTFKQVCFDSYLNKCIFCDWNDGSLDVNHLEGNRFTNNNKENLCFFCPNHHRVFSEGNISIEDCIAAREKYCLPQDESLYWAIFQGCEEAGQDDVFDIEVDGPHHSFIADKVIVHNCLNALLDGKSITDHYHDRKNGREEVISKWPILDSILGETFQMMIYQEQAMEIGQKLAGFNLAEVDIMRKGIGKKDEKIMAQVREMFMKGCAKTGIVDEQTAKDIFDMIAKSGRYLFNKSHSVEYALLGYLTAYAKAHTLQSFFTSWLFYAKEKQKPFDEIRLLINNAKLLGVEIFPPDFRRGNFLFQRLWNEKKMQNEVYFGLTNIKGVGEKKLNKAMGPIFQVENALEKKRDDWTWREFLIYLAPDIDKTIVEGLIQGGALDYFNVSRTKMLFEYQQCATLTKKERTWIKQNFDNECSLSSLLKKGMENKMCHDVRRVKKVEGVCQILDSPPYSLQDTATWLSRVEEAYLGLALTTSVVDDCLEAQRANNNCLDFLNGKGNNKIMIACAIDQIKLHYTKDKGDEMVFVEISDGGASINAVIFPDRWSEIKRKGVCVSQNTVMVEGSRSGRDKTSLIIEKMWQLT